MGEAIGQIIFGLIEAFFGRKLFWIFVAIGGFLIGWFLTPAFADGLATWVRILIGVVVGVVFALLAIWLTRFMVAVSGFFVFGTVTVVLIRVLGAEAVHGSTTYWVGFLVGGIVGAVLLGMFFDWALIIMTAVVGSGMAASGVNHFVPDEPLWLQAVLTVVLIAAGLLFQIMSYRRSRGGVGRGRRRVRA